MTSVDVWADHAVAEIWLHVPAYVGLQLSSHTTFPAEVPADHSINNVRSLEALTSIAGLVVSSVATADNNVV
jgi:hypothetical protein|tara:strand:+ start:182 stop:397 length:216 start_codon:yes stop_codon:yes gene_type:complete